MRSPGRPAYCQLDDTTITKFPDMDPSSHSTRCVLLAVLALTLLGSSTPIGSDGTSLKVKDLYPELKSMSADRDGDGLQDQEEAAYGTNPLEPDTDKDGLSDGFEVRPGLPAYSVLEDLDPRHADLIVYFRWRDVPRFDGYDVAEWVLRAKDFFATLDADNPDGRLGMNMVPIFGGTVPAIEVDTRTGADLAQAYMPAELRGYAHWIEVYPGGRGQTPAVPGNNSSCGSDGTWRTIIHELGHQLGLGHRGFRTEHDHPLNPLYPSLMSYRYSYSMAGSGEKIDLSHGLFRDVHLKETDISEHLPGFYPHQLGFLTEAPFNYRLRSTEGDRGTFIDWNRDGVFGQSHYRCDINQYGSIHTAVYCGPAEVNVASGGVCAVSNGDSFYLLWPKNSAGAAAKETDLATDPGEVYIWNNTDRQAVRLTDRIARGPVSAVLHHSDWLYVAVPVTDGTQLLQFSNLRVGACIATGTVPRAADSRFIPHAASVKTQLVSAGDKVLLLSWSPGAGIGYRKCGDRRETGPERHLTGTSIVDIGACWHPDSAHLCFASTRAGGRLELKRYTFSLDSLVLVGSEPIGLSWDASRTRKRPALAYAKLNTAMPGAIYVYYKAENDTGVFCSRQVRDRSYNGGWEEVFLDGVDAASNITVASRKDDILLAYRNKDGQVRAMYNASGIEDQEMWDFDDVDHIRNMGLRESLAVAW